MTGSRYITLRSGCTLPLEAVRFALDLEVRGLTLTVDRGDVVVSGPVDRITAEDRVAIQQFKPALAAIVDYVDTEHAL